MVADGMHAAIVRAAKPATSETAAARTVSSVDACCGVNTCCAPVEQT